VNQGLGEAARGDRKETGNTFYLALLFRYFITRKEDQRLITGMESPVDYSPRLYLLAADVVFYLVGAVI
jgi:hypothetical protein